MTDDIGNGRPTTASVDKRVERLEMAQSETDRKVEALSVKLIYMDEFMKLRFDGLATGQLAYSNKLDAFIAKMDAAILQATKDAADLGAYPAGRQVIKALDNLEQGQKDNEGAIDKVQERLAYYAGGLAVVMIALSIFGGTIARAIGLPQP